MLLETLESKKKNKTGKGQCGEALPNHERLQTDPRRRTIDLQGLMEETRVLLSCMKKKTKVEETRRKKETELYGRSVMRKTILGAGGKTKKKKGLIGMGENVKGKRKSALARQRKTNRKAGKKMSGKISHERENEKTIPDSCPVRAGFP